MEKENGKPLISIMPDFGNAPYAWIKRPSGKGETNLADCTYGIKESFPVSSEIDQLLCQWAMDFESNCEKKDFDWDTFHRKGLELAKRLKKELGDLADIRYRKPVEDPNHEIDAEIWITS